MSARNSDDPQGTQRDDDRRQVIDVHAESVQTRELVVRRNTLPKTEDAPLPIQGLLEERPGLRRTALVEQELTQAVQRPERILVVGAIGAPECPERLVEQRCQRLGRVCR
jgi:hypothetical protein